MNQLTLFDAPAKPPTSQSRHQVQGSPQSGSSDTRNARMADAEFRSGIAVASVAKSMLSCERELKTDCANHAAVFVAK